MKWETFASYCCGLLLAGLILVPSAARAADLPYRMTAQIVPVGDGVSLETRLYAPASRPEGYPLVVMIAGSGSNETTADPYTMLHVKIWTRMGIGVLAYNKRGISKSTGVQTEVDFDQRARDLAAIVAFAKKLPGVDVHNIGACSFSQGGWVVSRPAAKLSELKFLVMVSPGGVNPAVQTSYWLIGQFAQLGITQPEAALAGDLFYKILLYYATGNGYAETQAAVDVVSKTDWYRKVEKNPYWHDMAAPGRLFDPAGLKQAIKDKPGDFAWTIAPATIADYRADYAAITLPILIVYGGRDELVPTKQSQAVYEAAFRGNANKDVTFKTIPEGDHDIQISLSAVADGYREAVADWILAHTK